MLYELGFRYVIFAFGCEPTRGPYANEFAFWWNIGFNVTTYLLLMCTHRHRKRSIYLSIYLYIYMCVCVCVRVCMSVCVRWIHDVTHTHISLAIFAMSYFCTYLAIGHVSKFFNIGHFSTCFVIDHFCGASSSILQTTLLLSSNILEVYFYSDTRGGWRSKGTLRALITPEGFVKYVFFFEMCMIVSIE